MIVRGIRKVVPSFKKFVDDAIDKMVKPTLTWRPASGYKLVARHRIIVENGQVVKRDRIHRPETRTRVAGTGVFLMRERPKLVRGKRNVKLAKRIRLFLNRGTDYPRPRTAHVRREITA